MRDHVAEKRTRGEEATEHDCVGSDFKCAAIAEHGMWQASQEGFLERLRANSRGKTAENKGGKTGKDFLSTEVLVE